MPQSVRSHINKAWASVALLVAELGILLVIFFGALLIFFYLVRRVFVLKNSHFDQAVFDALTPYVNETTNDIMQVITFLGSHQFLIPANLLLIVYFLFVKKHRWYSIKIPAIAISSLALMFVLKYSFGRPRPLVPLLENVDGLSFPSGHALMSVTFYGLMGYIASHTIINKPLKWAIMVFCFIMILLIGFSRVYLRVHYTSDVIAGYCVGIIWLIISIEVMRRIERYSKRKLDPVVIKDPTPGKSTGENDHA